MSVQMLRTQANLDWNSQNPWQSYSPQDDLISTLIFTSVVSIYVEVNALCSVDNFFNF